MMEYIRGEGESAPPHLSQSRLSRYLLRPESYRLNDVEGIRPKLPAGSLIFGKAIHQALADSFTGGGDSRESFHEHWSLWKGRDVQYSGRESWAALATTGDALLVAFLKERNSALSNITAVEKSFELVLPGVDLPFVGVIDIVADLFGERTVIDFKTSSSSYADHEVLLSDQLAAYRLAVPGASQVAFCVLVKMKEPRVEWCISHQPDCSRVLNKAAVIGKAIQDGQFFLRPGKWCSWCDYLPICAGRPCHVSNSRPENV